MSAAGRPLPRQRKANSWHANRPKTDHSRLRSLRWPSYLTPPSNRLARSFAISTRSSSRATAMPSAVHRAGPSVQLQANRLDDDFQQRAEVVLLAIARRVHRHNTLRGDELLPRLFRRVRLVRIEYAQRLAAELLHHGKARHIR